MASMLLVATAPLWILPAHASDQVAETIIDQGNYLDISVQGSGIAPSALDLWKESIQGVAAPEGAGMANGRGELSHGHAFPLPPALLQPSLSLGYTSSGGSHSWVGRGWSLQSGLTVQRPPRGGERAYVGDGVRDVLIVSGDGLDGFFVQMDDGWHWESATPSTAKITFLAGGDIRIDSGRRRWTLEETTKRTWRTVRTRDRVGNLIDYTWTGSRLDRIDYGGTVAGVAHNVYVVFTHEALGPASTSASHGELETIDARLTRIDVGTNASTNNLRLRYLLSYYSGDALFADGELLVRIEEQDIQGSAPGTPRLRAEYEYHGLAINDADYEAVDAVNQGFDLGTSANLRQGPGMVNKVWRGLFDYSRDGLPDVVGPDLQVNPMLRDSADFLPSMWWDGYSVQSAFEVARPDDIRGFESTVTNVRVWAEVVGNFFPDDPVAFGENGTYRAMRMLDVDGDGLPDRVRSLESELLSNALGYSFDGDWSHDLAIAQLFPDVPIHQSGAYPYLDEQFALPTDSFTWEVCWGHTDPAIGFSSCDHLSAPFATPGVGSRKVLPQWGVFRDHGHTNDPYYTIDQPDITVDLMDMNADGWLDVVYVEPGGALYYYPYQTVPPSGEPWLDRRQAGWGADAQSQVLVSGVPALDGLSLREGYLDLADYRTGEAETLQVASIDVQETTRSTADINGDGLVDLLVAGSTAWTVYLGNGDGFESTGRSWAAPQPYIEKSFEGMPHVYAVSPVGGVGGVNPWESISATALRDSTSDQWEMTGGTAPSCFVIDLCSTSSFGDLPANSFLPIEGEDCGSSPPIDTTEFCSQAFNSAPSWGEGAGNYLDQLLSPERPEFGMGGGSSIGGEDAFVASGLLDMDADGRPDFFDGWNHVWHRNVGDRFEAAGRPLPAWWPEVATEDRGTHAVLSATYTEMNLVTGYQGQAYLLQAMGAPSTTRTWTVVQDFNGDRLPDVLVMDGGHQDSEPDGYTFAGGIEPQQPPGLLKLVRTPNRLENEFEYMSSTEVKESGHVDPADPNAVPVAVENHIVRPLLAKTSLTDPWDSVYTDGPQWFRTYAYDGAYCDKGQCWGFDSISKVDGTVRKTPGNGVVNSLNWTLSIDDYGLWDITGGRLSSSWVYDQEIADLSHLVFQQVYSYAVPANTDKVVVWPVTLTAKEHRQNSSRGRLVEHTYDEWGNLNDVAMHAGPLGPAGVILPDPEETVVQERRFVGTADQALWLPYSQKLFHDDGTGLLIEDEHMEFAYDDGDIEDAPTSGLLTLQRLHLEPGVPLSSEQFDWLYEYDARGQLDHETWPNGLEIDRTWDLFGGTAWHTQTVSGDFGAWTTLQSVDDMGRVNEVTDPNGVEKGTKYDVFGRVVLEYDTGAGSATALNRLYYGYVEATEYHPAQVLKTAPRFDIDGNLLSEHESWTVFDAMGREAVHWEATEGAGWRITGKRMGVHGYDEAEWTGWLGVYLPMVGINQLPVGSMPTYELHSYTRFSDIGEAIERWSPETGTTHIDRDEAGWTEEWSSTGTHVVGGDECSFGTYKRLRHDARGRLLEVYEGAPGEGWAAHTLTGSYRYDAMGRVRSFEDGVGQVYDYTYDGAGRVQYVELTNPNHGPVVFPGGVQPTPELWMTYTYDDALPKPTAMADAAGGISTWTYDQLGRQLTQTLSGRNAAVDEVTTWRYDTYPNGDPAWLGALTAVTFPTEHGDGGVRYRFDDPGTIVGGHGWVSLEEQFLPGAVPADNRTFTFTHDYDGQGWLTSTTWPDQPLPAGSLTPEHEYAPNGLPVRQSVVMGGGVLAYDLTYDQWGQLHDWTLDDPTGAHAAYGVTYRSSQGRIDGLAWDIDTSFHSVTYDYCGEDQRIAMRSYDNGTPHNLRYEYDRLGRIENVFSESGVTPATGALAEHYEYDAANRMTQMEVPAAGLDLRTFAYDDMGSPKTVTEAGGPTAYHMLDHDLALRLTGDTRSSGTAFDYAYDGSSRLVTVTKTASGSAVEVDYWYAPGDRIAQEVRSDGGQIQRFKAYQERNGTSFASVLPWLTLEDGVPRYTLAEPDGRASVVLSVSGVLQSERFVSAYGLSLTDLGGYAPSVPLPVGDWPLHGLHGSEPDLGMDVVHFGARHMALRGDGLWMQREPYLASNPVLGDLERPLAYGQAYGAGDTNLYADPSGKVAIVLAPEAVAAVAVVAYVAVDVSSGGAVSQSIWDGAVGATTGAIELFQDFAKAVHEAGGDISRGRMGPNCEPHPEASQGGGKVDTSWFPDRSLPRDEHGNPVPDSPHPHTQLGTKEGRNGSYGQAREFGENGQPVKDIDFTDHGRSDHPNPHQHRYLENETGGTPKRGPTEPLEVP